MGHTSTNLIRAAAVMAAVAVIVFAGAKVFLVYREAPTATPITNTATTQQGAEAPILPSPKGETVWLPQLRQSSGGKPTIKTVDPATVIAATPATLQISGNHFERGVKVALNKINLEIVGGVTPTFISARYPGGFKPGFYDITVTNPDGSQSTLFNALNVELQLTAASGETSAPSPPPPPTAPAGQIASPLAEPYYSYTITPPQDTTNNRQVVVTGNGFCGYNPGVSSVVLSGFPLLVDIAVPPLNIQSWTDSQVCFMVPDSVPPGTYVVTVRGYSTFGYCPPARASSTIEVR